MGTSSNGTSAAFGLNWYNNTFHTDVDNVLVLKNVDGENRVGIGTTSPDSKLHVNGNITLDACKTGSGYPTGSVGGGISFRAGVLTCLIVLLVLIIVVF